MVFNPNIAKQAQEEFFFFRKDNEAFSSPSLFKRSSSTAQYISETFRFTSDQRLGFSKQRSMKKSLKPKNEYQSLKNFVIFCREIHFLITTILYVIDQPTKVFQTKSKWFSKIEVVQ